MIVRVKPYKDTFTVGGLVKKNNGQDEILELGYSDLVGTEGSSRILLTFSTRVPDNYNQHAHRVLLNLKEVRSENITDPCTIHIYSISSDWLEGTGHISDDPDTQDGVSRKLEPKPEDLVGSVTFTSEDLTLDLKVDITDIFDSQKSNDFVSFLLKLSDESLAESNHTRIMYYSKNTHTCSWPYLDFEIEDSVQESELEEVPRVPFRLITQGLRKNCNKGDRFRVDVNVVPVFPSRQFTTGSLYRTHYKVPEGTTYGIVDEYTGEVVVSAENNLGTIVSSDNSGSFIMLYTDMLEPERYYRLVFSLTTRERCKHCLYEDVRRTFRVGRLWKTR